MSKGNQFKNKVVWITGASSGIGAALAFEFAKIGAKIVLSARTEAELQKVKNQCGAISGNDDDYLVLPLDITAQDSLEAHTQRAHQWGGSIDMLINNAGISQRSSCLNTSMDTYRTIIDVDVVGQIALTKAVLPIMVAQKSGHFAVTSSVSGKIGVPFRTGYCAAKHAMMGFFDSLRTEVTQYGIKVTTITPGFIRTDISARAVAGDGSVYGREDAEIRGGMDVNKCAEVIMRGFQKGKLEIPVGNGPEMKALWLKRLSPTLLFRLAAKQYDKMAKNNDLK